MYLKGRVCDSKYKAMNAIEVSHRTKHFGKLVALENVNFSVTQGEIFGFLGPPMVPGKRPRFVS